MDTQGNVQIKEYFLSSKWIIALRGLYQSTHIIAFSFYSMSGIITYHSIDATQIKTIKIG